MVSAVNSGATGVWLLGLHVGTNHRQLLSNHCCDPRLIWCMSTLSLLCCCGEGFYFNWQCACLCLHTCVNCVDVCIFHCVGVCVCVGVCACVCLSSLPVCLRLITFMNADKPFRNKFSHTSQSLYTHKMGPSTPIQTLKRRLHTQSSQVLWWWKFPTGREESMFW